MKKRNYNLRPRFPVYVYPERNPLYKELADKYQRTGKQALIRKLFLHGWAIAYKEFEAFRVTLTGAVGEPKSPLDEADSTLRLNNRYDLYLTQAEHSDKIAYLRSLPDDLRQRFLLLVLVRGMELENIDELLYGL
jgi:hypothetical protein